MKFFLLCLCGLAAGVVGGMGMGGGTFLIPLLTFFFGVGAHDVVTVNLLSFIPTAFISLCFHFRNGLVKFKGLVAIVVPALCASVATYFLARNVEGAVLNKLFGGFLIVSALCGLIKGRSKKD